MFALNKERIFYNNFLFSPNLRFGSFFYLIFFLIQKVLELGNLEFF